MSPTEGQGLSLRAFIPNAVTVLALCAGLTGIRYGIAGEWEKAMIAIVVAGVLDGMDGRIARMLKANSKFGAELDSLCDNIGFGTAPALILFQWSLANAPKFGWTVALALAISCALRLARFNSRIDAEVQLKVGIAEIISTATNSVHGITSRQSRNTSFDVISHR